jgi:hypothetical protein
MTWRSPALFNVVGADKAQFVVNNVGVVNDRSGKSVLQKNYSGGGRGRIHAFADDIVETLTGTPGIASSKIAFVGTKTGPKEIYTCDADGAGGGATHAGWKNQRRAEHQRRSAATRLHRVPKRLRGRLRNRSRQRRAEAAS